MRTLIIGGTGFLSGTVSRLALEDGHEVSILTRGKRAVDERVRHLCVDRKNREEFSALMSGEEDWDLVVDCIAYDADDARQDIEAFSGRCGCLAFVSTDFVYEPTQRSVPQPEIPATFSHAGYGGKKREAELELWKADIKELSWTIFRPSHIFGPGSLPGCLPLHSRDASLIDHLKNKRPLHLVGGGHYLQHPVFAPDLAMALLDLPSQPGLAGSTLNIANPDVIESRHYYELLGEALGAPAHIEAIDTASFLAENPDKAPFCCDRVMDLTRLARSGLRRPQTSLKTALEFTLQSWNPA